MAGKFDAESFGRLAFELEAFKQGGRKPNGILSLCVDGILSVLGNDPQTFELRVVEKTRSALSAAVTGASVVELTISSPKNLFSAVRQEKNGLLAVQQGKLHCLDQAIRFARAMEAHLRALETASQ